MNRSIEQMLLSLLPTHGPALPQPLTDLASSLLAQSRSRASTLKAEEEVARLYACAHLACDRLKRLYNHLDKILPAASSTPGRHTPSGTPLGSGRVRTPSTKIREQQQQQQQLLNVSPLASKLRTTTPGKERFSSLSDLRARAGTTTPSKDRTALSSSSTAAAAAAAGLPRWMRPVLRYLLTNLGPARIGPVVAAGLESVVAPRGRPADDGWVRAHPVPVLGALYLFVWRGVVWPAGREVDRERYVRMRREVAHWLARAREEVAVGGGAGGGGYSALGEDDADGDRDADADAAAAVDAGWEGWEEPSVKDFDAAAVRGARHGWFDMDWVDGVRDLADREEAKKRAAEGGDDGAEGAGEVVVQQIRRPDTMFQERYDYLSERKRKAYADWKQGLLKRIKELEAR
ncbi:hypothetical protein VTH06DRAFT_1823 [Thermothelomyces fergusii]